jgi:hypothetical protein
MQKLLIIWVGIKLWAFRQGAIAKNRIFKPQPGPVIIKESASDKTE